MLGTTYQALRPPRMHPEGWRATIGSARTREHTEGEERSASIAARRNNPCTTQQLFVITTVLYDSHRPSCVRRGF